ncbi:DUF1120 domain-containing protein [Pseudomonas sp. MDT1-16]
MASVYRFGLGKQDATNIGLYTIAPVNATGDGTPVDLIMSDTGAPWVAASGSNMAHDYNRIVSFAPAGTVVPGAFQNFSGTFNVTATIAATSTLDLSQSITLDGLSTLEVRYL